MSSLEPKESFTNEDEVIVTPETLQTVRNRLRPLEDESLYKDEILTSQRKSYSQTDEITLSFSKASPSERLSFGDWRASLLNKEKGKDHHIDLRRKSYGFENLENRETFGGGMESSTDSGLGLSSDFSSLMSPTNERKKNFTDNGRSKLSPTRITLFNNNSHVISLPKTATPKRHSIPAGLPTGSKLDFDGKTSILVNGNTEDESSSLDGILDETGKKTKRVEFCKTEIHFAPDSGKVNIVETDGKPPPTNNFRRRRRSSGSSGTPTTASDIFNRFDEQEDIKLIPEVKSNTFESIKSNSSFIALNNSGDSNDDVELKGILKNKPMKPRQYHLGENLKDIDTIWGVKLNPVYNELSLTRDETTDPCKAFKN